MSHHFHDNPLRRAPGQEQASKVVAQAVEGVASKVGTVANPVEIAVDVSRLQDRPDC
jgi:hypothetical protein